MELTVEEKEKVFKRQEKKNNDLENMLKEIKKMFDDKNINEDDLEKIKEQVLICYKMCIKTDGTLNKRLDLIEKTVKDTSQKLTLGADEIKRGISEGIKASAKEVITDEAQTSLNAVKTTLMNATDEYVKKIKEAQKTANRSAMWGDVLNKSLIVIILMSMGIFGFIGYTLGNFKTELVGRLEVVEDRESFIFNEVKEIRKELKKGKK